MASINILTVKSMSSFCSVPARILLLAKQRLDNESLQNIQVYQNPLKQFQPNKIKVHVYQRTIEFKTNMTMQQLTY